MLEENKERLSKAESDYLYIGSERRTTEIRADESVIREVLDKVLSEHSGQPCAIPITFDRKRYDRRKQREIIQTGI